MSGALVPTSTNFQQQGSVDWVELSSRSVHFSVAVLARLSRAGIDPFTLQVGRAICTNFSLHPIAQGRISDAILALKKFGSYGDVIWFGFGVKHIVTDLAETEEGLTLVALCAALSTTYDSLYGARVLRELCGLCKAPQSFSPAIRQWKILVELCAGILTSGHFVLVLDGFHRLALDGRNRNISRLAPRRSPTTYSALAEAILTIAHVTTKRLASATFTGGLDCMWLAAVAEWLFSLDVVIYSSADVPLYRSRSLDQKPPQITVVYHENLTGWEEQTLVSERRSLIGSGRTLFIRQDGDSMGDRHFSNWRSSWSTILHDTFHESVDKLLTGENAYQFGLYLYCVSMIQEPDPRFKSDSDSLTDLDHIYSKNFVDPLLWTQESSRGHKFLSYASKRLPELGCCLGQDFSTIPQNELSRHGLGARNKIEHTCDDHPLTVGEDATSGICLRKLAEVIIAFLWITLVSDIDSEITPSVTGLSDLYRWNTDVDRFPSRLKLFSSLSERPQQTALVFYVLSGLGFDSEEQVSRALPTNYQAMAGAGLCVYRQALVDPNLPPDSIFKFRVVSGYISHSGAIFKRVRNLSGRTNAPSFSWDATSTCRSVDAIVQETDRDSELGMVFQVDYIDSERQRKYFFVSPGRLLRNLQSSVSAFKCEGGCSELPIQSQQTIDRPDMNTETSMWRHTRRYPVVLFDQAAIVNAQCLIADLKGLSNLWVFSSVDLRYKDTGEYTGVGSKYCPMNMLIGRPFMIYMFLMSPMEDSLCLFPFVPCLSCMTERGCLARVYRKLQDTLPSTGFLKLTGLDGTEEKMTWSTSDPSFLGGTHGVSR